MEYICIGKISGTHGIKGEIKIKSDFQYKDKVFIIDNVIYVGNTKKKEVIKSYRVHKNYDMITLAGYIDINQVLNMIGSMVYLAKEDLKLEEGHFLDTELIGYNVFCIKNLGKVKEIFDAGNGNKIVKTSEYAFPYHKDFIERIDKNTKTIYLSSLDGVFECK